MVAQSALCHLLLQLTPRASAWGREKQIFISGPWKRRKGRAETGNPEGGCVVGILFSLGRVWNWGTRMGGQESLRGPQESSRTPQRRGGMRGWIPKSL